MNPSLCSQAVEGLLDATSGADADLLLRYRECHLLVLKGLQDGRAYGSPWCNKQITRWGQDAGRESRQLPAACVHTWCACRDVVFIACVHVCCMSVPAEESKGHVSL